MDNSREHRSTLAPSSNSNNRSGGLRASVEVFLVLDFRHIELGACEALEAAKIISLGDKR